MNPKNFFLRPRSTGQHHYEALRAFYVEGLHADEAAERFGLSPAYFKKLRFEFCRDLKAGTVRFFRIPKKGPKKRRTDEGVLAHIIALRKKNHSIQDIRAMLDSQGQSVSLDTIDKILKAEGFAPLPRRTRQERIATAIPAKIQAPPCAPLEYRDEEFFTERGAGPLVFLPLIEQLGIVPAVRAAGFAHTSVLSDIASVFSFLALKLLGNERWSHDAAYNLDRGLGLFAGLNVLPKNGTLSSYSSRIQRASNKELLLGLSRCFRDPEAEEGEFNLDFKAIPHWGDASVLENNWSGARSRGIKSLLALLVQDPATGFLSYSDAEIRHRNQSEAVFEFVDFWKQGRGVQPKMLIFDARFTTYAHLSQLNEGDEPIKFLTLRRRGKKLMEQVEKIPEGQWQTVTVEGEKGKPRQIRVNDSACVLRNYDGWVWQLILTDHGHKRPAFLITNDFDMDVRHLIRKYARRWLVEHEIAEQVAFFHLNQPSSSIVVKLDCDLTISLLAHNLFRVLTRQLPGFERCTVPTISRDFLENGARIQIENRHITVHLKKKTHLPILFELPWMTKETHLSWMGVSIGFVPATFS
jgi:transposase